MTLVPRRLAVAFFVQARPRVVVPSLLCSRVQPAGSPRVPLSGVDGQEQQQGVAGLDRGRETCTVWLVRLPALLAAATNDSVGSAASARGAGLRPRAGRAATRVAATSARTALASAKPPRIET